MKKIKYNDTYIYVDDTPVDINETGIAFNQYYELENTMKIPKNNLPEELQDTLIDLWKEKK